jgi:hypothetical protein
MVIMFSDLRALIYEIIETIDVDLPDPVGHVTKTRPVFLVRTLVLIISATSVNINSEISLEFELIFLITMPTFPSLK